MNISFERDLSHNYMIPEIGKKIEADEYQIHMLTENRIRGLLECSVKKVNCAEQYYYEITSRQSLTQICENSKLKTEDIRKILKGLQQTLQETEKYLLDENHMVLDPECIYLDIESGQVWFCYLPIYDGVLTRSFRMLTTFFLSHIDQEDQKAVLLGYQIYRMSMEENYSLLKLLQTTVEEPQYKEKVPEQKKDIPEIKEQTHENSLAQLSPGGPKKKLKKSPDKAVNKVVNKTAQEKNKNVWFGIGAVSVMLLAGAAAWLEILTVTQAGGIAFLLTGLIGYMRTFQKKQLEQKKKDPGEKLVKNEIKAEKNRVKRESRPAVTAEEAMMGATVVLKEAEEEYLPRLTLLSMNSRDRSSVVLINESYLIGKLKNKTDIYIDDPAVSRIHAKIQKNGEDYYLCDMNSTNGTFVNGRRLEVNEKVKLNVSDEISFAETGFYVGNC